MSNTVAFIFKAIDRFSPVIKKVSNVTQKANNQLKGLSRVANRVDEAFLKIQFAAGAAAMKIKKAGGAAEFAKKKFGKLGKKLRSTGRDFTIGATLPVGLFVRSLIKAASDSVETGQKFNVVFKDIQTEANKVAKNLSKNFGLSSDAAKELIGNTADLLTGFGFSQKSALDLSKQVQELGVDLASFTNFSGGAEGASQALTKALLGERESVKSLGISILEEDVKKKIQILRAKGMQFQTLRQAKAIATLTIAQEQSKNAIGDFARSQETLAKETKLTNAAFEDLKGELGVFLLPLAIAATKIIRQLIQAFRELSPTTQKIILGVAAFVAVVGPLLLLLGGIIAALPIIIIGLKAMGVAMAVALGPFSIVIALVGAAIAAIILLRNNWETVSNVIGGTIEQIGINFNIFVDNLVKKINAIKTTIKVLADQATFGLFDFAGDENIPGKNGTNFGGTVESVTKSQTDINVNMNAPKGVVKNIKSKSTGSTSANLGINMITSPGL